MKKFEKKKKELAKKGKSWMDAGLTGTFDRKAAEARIKKTGSVL